ncbi:MAG: phosphatase PAP2 family protein [Bacteroidales bacterium]|nr:phosphatase PAP2 family protein [Bacteroidales bacterium]
MSSKIHINNRIDKPGKEEKRIAEFSSVFLLLMCLMVISPAVVLSQDSVSYPYSKFNKAYIISGFKDARDVVVSPIHWKGKQWVTLGVLAASAAILYTQDDKIREFAQGHWAGHGDMIVKYGLEPLGSGKSSIPLIAELYFAGRFTHHYRLSATALTAAKSAAISSAVTLVVKQMAHRHRPYQDIPADAQNWDGPNSSWKYSSFPSGHTTLAFSIATVFASEYSNTIWVPALCYTLATGTALSRIKDDKHWASDVLIGAGIGYFTGRFLWKKNRNVVVVPQFSSGTTGMMIQYSF